jgi:hypothetical protein
LAQDDFKPVDTAITSSEDSTEITTASVPGKVCFCPLDEAKEKLDDPQSHPILFDNCNTCNTSKKPEKACGTAVCTNFEESPVKRVQCQWGDPRQAECGCPEEATVGDQEPQDEEASFFVACEKSDSYSCDETAKCKVFKEKDQTVTLVGDPTVDGAKQEVPCKAQ